VVVRRHVPTSGAGAVSPVADVEVALPAVATAVVISSTAGIANRTATDRPRTFITEAPFCPPGFA
jgi:hypothetical protein